MITYYLICLFYCFAMSYLTHLKYSSNGNLYGTPALDSIVYIILCWVLAPVDFFLTFTRLYREAEETRRKTLKMY